MKKTFTFAVEMTVPDWATEAETRAFVEDAVATWPGQCRPPGAHGDDDPGDPMWELEVVSVKNTARQKRAAWPLIDPSQQKVHAMQTFVVTRTQTIADPKTGQPITIPVKGYYQGPGQHSVVSMMTKLLNTNAARAERKTLAAQFIPGLDAKVQGARHMTQEERRLRKLEDKLFRAEGERATELAAQAQQARLALTHKLAVATVNDNQRRKKAA